LAEAPSPAPPDLVAFAFHWLELLGLLGGIGSLAVRRLSRMPPRIGWVDPPMHLAFGAALAGGAGLLVMSPSVPLLARVAAEGVALFLCVRGIPLVAVFAVAAACLLPLTGHAAGVEPQPAGAEFADILHVLSAAMWAGGILALGSLRPPEGWRSADARALVGRFERVAQVAFAVTALTGVLRAAEQLSDVSDLWTTAYGEVLAVKILGVLAMLAVSVAWRRGSPMARADAAIAVAVVGVTALLAAFPLPVN
jgi:putative copper export protein